MANLLYSSCIVGSSLNYFKGLNPAADWEREKMTENKQKQTISYFWNSSCIVDSALNYFKGFNPAANWHQEKMTDTKTKTNQDLFGLQQLHSW